MGWLKKLTKPISKVLDKIIPNEIKPALPYLSAFAPYLLGPGAGGIMSNIGINNPMLQRAIMTGGINIGSQLAQEGSEGEFSGLSALLAAGQGALTAPGAEQSLRGNMVTRDPVTGDLIPMKDVAGITEGGELMKVANLPGDLEEQALLNLTAATPATNLGMGTEGIKQLALKGGAEGAKFLGGAKRIISDPSQWGMNKETLGAFATPVTQGTADLAMADARRALADYNAGLEEGTDAWYDDNARRVSIRSAMEAAGHVEDDILDAIASLGLRQGGIVGLRNGGRIGFNEGGFEPFKYTSKIKEMWEMEGEDDPLGTIVKIGLTFRAPIVDIVRILGFTGVAGASLVAEVAKLGYDVTKPIRDVGSDIVEGVYDVGKDLVKGSKTDTRFIQPMYYLERFGPKRNLTDEETQLKMMSNSVGRNDPKKRRELENIVFGFDDAGMNQTDEDMEVSEQIKFNEKYNMAEGGMMSVLPRGTEMDYRGGGMIPMGSKEKADDVPARLSKNEFVMTADAVRAAGGGSVNRGAKRMYDLMHNLEARV